jgi:membrane-bound lytic murein transglycosylase B
LLVVVLALVAGLLPALPAAAVRSDSSDELHQQAAAAAARADRLQHRLDRSLARYQAALTGLAGSVNSSVADERAATAAAAQEAAARAGQEAQVRALYMSGGSLGVIGSILDAQSPADLASRVVFASQVLELGAQSSHAAATVAAHARDRAEVSSTAAQHAVVTIQDVEASALRLQRLVDRTRAAVTRLNDAAQRAAAAERLAAAQAAAAAAATSAASSVKAGGIPVDYLRLYQQAAATCPMPWVVLAAVGQVESGHGSNVGPSSSGAEGPMQFLPSTFAAYAVDGNGDGVKDIWNPADSIYTAARYLCANGAGRSDAGLYQALWHYNHVDWYVQLVMNVAGQLAQRFGVPVPVATQR